MDSCLIGLDPDKVWFHFGEITKIPRCSKNEGQIIAWLERFAQLRSFHYMKDDVGNIVIHVPASSGYEKSPVVVLQAHVDMVCEKNKSVTHDFSTDPIKLQREGNWLKAVGTTLGADNGIGVALALAIADSTELTHGPLELLFTVDEESGLTGARNLRPDFLKGRILINLDSEEMGSIYIGCAGGLDTIFRLPITREPAPEGTIPFILQVRGLTGGHSGLNIHEGRGNAIKILNRVLLPMVRDTGARISRLSGGSKPNAIPREAEAELYMNPAKTDVGLQIAAEMQELLRSELPPCDRNIEITLTGVPEGSGTVIDAYDQDRIILFTYTLPSGVIAMSYDMPGLVETSMNIGVLTTEDEHVVYTTSQRSSIDSVKADLGLRMRAMGELAGAIVEQGVGYPGWKPNLQSPTLELAKTLWKVVAGTEPKIKAVHAGLECGIIGEKYPGMDMISIGPTITGAHSPAEAVDVESVAKIFKFTKLLIKMIAENEE